MTLYHITNKQNINSILENGIIPFKEIGFTKKSNREMRKRDLIKHYGYDDFVYLTDDVLFLAKTQLIKSMYDSLCVIELKDGLDVKELLASPKGYNVVCSHEFVFRGTIHPSEIKEIYPLSGRVFK